MAKARIHLGKAILAKALSTLTMTSTDRSDASSLSLPVLAVIYGGLLSVWALTSYYTWPVGALMVAATFKLTGARLDDFNPISMATGPRRHKVALLWTVLYAINLWRRFIENPEVLAEVSASDMVDRFNQNLLFKDVMLYFGVANLFLFNRRHTLSQKMWVFLVALAIYGLANLALEVFFPGRARIEFGASRVLGKEGRWSPALSRSNEVASSLFMSGASAMAATLAYCVVLKGRESLRLWQFAVMAGAMLVLAYCGYKAEFRGHLLALVGVAGFTVATLFGAGRIVIVTLLVGGAIFPQLFFGEVGPAVMDALPIDEVLEMIGAKGNRDKTLTGRTELWYYAGTRLSSVPEILALGEGPALRDASVMESTALFSGYRMNYHSGMIELLMANGLPLATAMFGVLAAAAWGTFANHRGGGMEQLGLFMLLSWLAATLTLAFVGPSYAYFETAVLIVMPLLSAWPRLANAGMGAASCKGHAVA